MKKHEHDQDLLAHSAQEGIRTAFWLNFGFALLEIAGGFFTNSIAILSDAVHDIGDSMAIAAAYVCERVSKRGPDNRYTFGYARFSLLAALFTAAILLAGSGVMAVAAIGRLRAPQAVYAPGMIVLAVLGVTVNGIAVLRTAHGHNLNERVISLHMLEDVLTWGVMLAGSVCMQAFGWTILDPLLSIGVAAFILCEAASNLWAVLRVLMERVPEGFDVEAFRGELLRIQNVDGIHALRVWSLDGEDRMAALHAVMAPGAEGETVSEVRRAIEETARRYGVEQVTVQMECVEEPCRLRDAEDSV